MVFDMTLYCRNCGEKLKDDAQFCGNCGEKVPKVQKSFINKTQVVTVDNVQFELPADYVSEPSRFDENYDGNVKSTARAWSNDKHYIEIGVTRSLESGVNSDEVASSLGGTPTKMFGYTGYYLEYDYGGYAFVFGLKDEVCMIYVSDYDAFSDVKVIGQV